MTRRFAQVGLALCLLLSSPAAAAAPAAGEPQTVVKKGVRVEFFVEPVDAGAQAVTEGEYAEIRFRVTDAETGALVSPLQPAVWINRTSEAEKTVCRQRISRYLQGMLAYQADVDLNKYFILIMNDDPTIAVVDPLLGVSGITQLYAMIMLEKPGEDWARSADDTLLYVTMPKAGKVAMVDLGSFKVLAQVDAGSNPMRIAMQPDGKYLWVGNDGAEGAESGVTVIDARTFSIAGRIPTGPGHHEIAFSDDSLFALVTNRDADTTSVIDVQRLEKVKDLATGQGPLAVGFSSLSRAAYVASADGTLAMVDTGTHEITARLSTEPGLSGFSLDPSGRWGFAALEEQDRVDILDVSRGAISQRLEVGDRPHRFAFTDTYAYVRHLGTADVTMIPLAQLGRKQTPAVQRVALGNRAPGEYPDPAVADAISPTGEWTSVVSANPADKMVYYYMEGMIAPMGSYTTYGRVPRAVGVVDRSVSETEKGIYSAKFRVPESGEYNVAILLDAPVVDHCFKFNAQPNPDLAVERNTGGVQLDFLAKQWKIPAGEPLDVRFALKRPGSEMPLSDLQDVVVLATRPPGSWQERLPARSLPHGVYEVTLPEVTPGVYYVSVGVPSLGVDFSDLPHVSFMAVDGDSSERKGR